MLSSCRTDRIDCRKISWTVGNSVAGALIVGRHPIQISQCSHVKILNPVLSNNSLFDQMAHVHALIPTISFVELSVLHFEEFLSVQMAQLQADWSFSQEHVQLCFGWLYYVLLRCLLVGSHGWFWWCT